jgi:hypothetical protein
MESMTASVAHPGDELTGLLTRIASDPALTCHLHRVLGPFCHECRNILHGLKLSLYLAGRKADPSEEGPWKEMEARYSTLETLIDRVQQISRPSPFQPVRLPLHLLFDDRRAVWDRELAASGRRLAFKPPAAPVVAVFDPCRLGRAFDDLVAWRARQGAPGSALTLSWFVNEDSICVEWSECAGSGQRDRQGRTGCPGSQSLPNAGRACEPDADGPDPLSLLALPLITRVASQHGGAVETDDRKGWRLGFRWPRDG